VGSDVFYLDGCYLRFCPVAGYTLGNYLLVFVAAESLSLTGELPHDPKGLTYDHYVTDAQMMFRYWTVPPVIFVIAPTLIMFLLSRLRVKEIQRV
jgi:hypothetical protein